MFIIPHLPKTQEEEYKVYPWASSLCFSAHKRANAPFFYPVPCKHQTTSTSSLPACRHPSHGRTNKTSCPSPCHGSTLQCPCCLSASLKLRLSLRGKMQRPHRPVIQAFTLTRGEDDTLALLSEQHSHKRGHLVRLGPKFR